jgi:hypothetical protein
LDTKDGRLYGLEKKPSNREESIAILDGYKDKLTDIQYNRLYDVISTMAIEDLYLDTKTISNLVKLEQCEITEEEYYTNIKKQHQWKSLINSY